MTIVNLDSMKLEKSDNLNDGGLTVTGFRSLYPAAMAVFLGYGIKDKTGSHTPHSSKACAEQLENLNNLLEALYSLGRSGDYRVKQFKQKMEDYLRSSVHISYVENNVIDKNPITKNIDLLKKSIKKYQRLLLKAKKFKGPLRFTKKFPDGFACDIYYVFGSGAYGVGHEFLFNIGGESCPLCEAYRPGCGCGNCPIKTFNNAPNCRNTPWTNLNKYFTAMNGTSKELQELIQAEIDYLKEVLEAEKKKTIFKINTKYVTKAANEAPFTVKIGFMRTPEPKFTDQYKQCENCGAWVSVDGDWKKFTKLSLDASNDYQTQVMRVCPQCYKSLNRWSNFCTYSHVFGRDFQKNSDECQVCRKLKNSAFVNCKNKSKITCPCGFVFGKDFDTDDDCYDCDGGKYEACEDEYGKLKKETKKEIELNFTSGRWKFRDYKHDDMYAIYDTQGNDLCFECASARKINFKIMSIANIMLKNLCEDVLKSWDGLYGTICDSGHFVGVSFNKNSTDCKNCFSSDRDICRKENKLYEIHKEKKELISEALDIEFEDINKGILYAIINRVKGITIIGV